MTLKITRIEAVPGDTSYVMVQCEGGNESGVFTCRVRVPKIVHPEIGDTAKMNLEIEGKVQI